MKRSGPGDSRSRQAAALRTYWKPEEAVRFIAFLASSAGGIILCGSLVEITVASCGIWSSCYSYSSCRKRTLLNSAFRAASLRRAGHECRLSLPISRSDGRLATPKSRHSQNALRRTAPDATVSFRGPRNVPGSGHQRRAYDLGSTGVTTLSTSSRALGAASR